MRPTPRSAAPQAAPLRPDVFERIQELRTFIEAGNLGSERTGYTETGVMWQVLIHITPTGPNTADGTCYAILGGGALDADGNAEASPAFYTDTLVKTPQGWRFKTREVFIGVPGDKNF